MNGNDMIVSASKGSVFDDLGYAPEHRVKADMSLMIKSRMKSLKLNQTNAAKRMSIKQPDLSNILRGHFRGYSVERLTRLLTALDCDVDIVIRPRGQNAKPHVIRMNAVLV